MSIMSKLTAAYLAGLVDGEGYIGIMKMNSYGKQSSRDYFYLPVIKICMTDRKIIEWLRDSFGGTFETRKAHHNAKESYAWTCRKAAVMEFLKKIHQHLRVKNKQADIIFKFFTLTNGTGHKLSDNHWVERETLYNLIRQLNKRGAA